jgi:molybdopterin-guanine dinucleotide biosynthesis protein A
MGTAKANLPFGPECMLTRMVRILSSVLSPVVVVAAAEQPVPALPPEVLLAYDAQAERGPLMGLATGLALLEGQVDAVFLSGCDTPLLKPEFISAMLAELGEHAMLVPQDDSRVYPLASVYRMQCLPHVQALLAADCLRMTSIFERLPTRFIATAALREVDANLHSLLNVNTPADYDLALRLANLP